MRDLLLGHYAMYLALPLAELRRGWKRASRRIRRRVDPFEEARLPVVSWRKCAPQRAIRIWEPRAEDGNVTVGEVAVLALFAADCAEGAHIFEFGTFDGRTTLNLALNAPRDCTICTLDLPAESDTGFPLLDVERQYVQKPSSGARYEKYRRSHPALAGRIRQLLGDSAMFDITPYENRCSLVFVDASHAYDYVVSDSLMAMKMIHAGGVVLWHDYGVWKDVTRALNELDRQGEHSLARISGTSLVYWRKPG